MANETVIVVHPFRDYHTELEPSKAEFTEFLAWADLTPVQRADVLRSQAAYDYLLTSEHFVHEAGIPEEWEEYLGTGDFDSGELEPLGLGKLSARAATHPGAPDGDRNYTEIMIPVFKRIARV